MKEFSDVYQQSVNKVYRFLLGLCGNASLAEELTEETFYRAFLDFRKFKGKCSVETWLCQIAKHLYFRECRRSRRFALWEDGMWQAQPGEADAFADWEDREDALQIFRLVHRLEEPYREVFLLKVFGELTFREIAQVNEKSESWAKMTYYRAKARIRTLMEEG